MRVKIVLAWHERNRNVVYCLLGAFLGVPNRSVDAARTDKIYALSPWSNATIHELVPIKKMKIVRTGYRGKEIPARNKPRYEHTINS